MLFRSGEADILEALLPRYISGQVLSALAALVLVPWWGRVSAPGVLRAAEEQAVYTPVPARLSSTVLPRGTAVDAGQALLRLEAPLQAEERAKAEAMSAAWRHQAQGALGVDDETRAAKLALAETSAARFDAERQARARELARTAGVFMLGAIRVGG